MMKFETKVYLLLALTLLLIGSTPNECLASELRLLVPAYGNPCCGGGPEMWTRLTETAAVMGPDLLVILNPASGPGIGQIDPNYVNNLGQGPFGPFLDFRNAGGVAYGYVRTQWAARSLADVQSEVDLYYDPAYWREAGVQIDGIFFDEMSNDLADVGYYQTLRDYVRSIDPAAGIVGNPGTTFVNNPSGQTTWSVSDYAESADTLVTFENNAEEYFDNYTPPSWLASYPVERFGHIVFGVEDVDQMLEALHLAIQRKAGYVYLTDDDLPNPYDVLASFWADQVEAVQILIFGDGFETGDAGAWTP